MASKLRQMKIKYKNHKSRAKRRKIEFHFTFDEWVKWWEDHLGNGWPEKRGPRKHQYCMARFEDKGHYVIGNVKCITNEENNAEQVPHFGVDPYPKNRKLWWVQMN